MVLSERIAVALLTVFLRSVFRKLPFVQAPIIENTSSNYFMNPHFVVAGGVFYFVTRNRCRSWLERFRTRPNFEPPGVDKPGQVHRLSKNKVQKAQSWLDRYYGTLNIFQRAPKHGMLKDQGEGDSANKKTLHPKIRRGKRRRHSNSIKVYREPQPSTSRFPPCQGDGFDFAEILPPKQIDIRNTPHQNLLDNNNTEEGCAVLQPLRMNDSSSRECLPEVKIEDSQSIHSGDAQKPFLESIRPIFTAPLKSSDEALSNKLYDGIDHKRSLRERKIPEICNTCCRKKRRNRSYPTDKLQQFPSMSNNKRNKHKHCCEVPRKTRSGMIYGWLNKCR